MTYAKTSLGYFTMLLALGIIRSEAFVPSVRVAYSGKDKTRGDSRCWRRSPAAERRASCMSADSEHDILLRVAQGGKADRPPVWLMRQVGINRSSSKYRAPNSLLNPMLTDSTAPCAWDIYINIIRTPNNTIDALASHASCFNEKPRLSITNVLSLRPGTA